MANKQKINWFAFYPADWLEGTMDMTLEQVGAYIQILSILYMHNNRYKLRPTNQKAFKQYDWGPLSRRLGVRREKGERLVRELMQLEKLYILQDCLSNARVADEIEKAEAISAKNREAAKRRWQPKAGFGLVGRR